MSCNVHGQDITRQIIHHAPVVHVLVHNVANDTWLVEREYRVGVDKVCLGLPAGFIEPEHAAIHEETGVIVDMASLHPMGTWNSSEGFTDERAHVFLADINNPEVVDTHFDADEYVESAMCSWMP